MKAILHRCYVFVCIDCILTRRRVRARIVHLSVYARDSRCRTTLERRDERGGAYGAQGNDVDMEEPRLRTGGDAVHVPGSSRVWLQRAVALLADKTRCRSPSVTFSRSL